MVLKALKHLLYGPEWNYERLLDFAEFVEDMPDIDPGVARNLPWAYASVFFINCRRPGGFLLEVPMLAKHLRLPLIEVQKLVFPITTKATPPNTLISDISRSATVATIRRLAKTGKTEWILT